MNSLLNRIKQVAYAQSIMKSSSEGKWLIHIDEMNCNMLLKYSQRKSKKVSKYWVNVYITASSSRDSNIDIIGAISENGLVY